MFFEIGLNWQTILSVIILIIILGIVLGIGEKFLKGWRGIGTIFKIVIFVILFIMCLFFLFPREKWPKFNSKVVL